MAELALLGGICAAGCGQVGDEQATVDRAMRAICDSPAAVAAAGEVSVNPAEQAAAASRWIAANVDDPSACGFFAELAGLPPERKAARLREAATRAGVGRCALAEIWAARVR